MQCRVCAAVTTWTVCTHFVIHFQPQSVFDGIPATDDAIQCKFTTTKRHLRWKITGKCVVTSGDWLQNLRCHSAAAGVHILTVWRVWLPAWLHTSLWRFSMTLSCLVGQCEFRTFCVPVKIYKCFFSSVCTEAWPWQLQITHDKKKKNWKAKMKQNDLNCGIFCSVCCDLRSQCASGYSLYNLDRKRNKILFKFLIVSVLINQ